ncbi:MAG: hypothetical protein JWQ36_1078 [Enterovirga sp.]|jgi:hypothetical protein|nr:hypothetical protein [Enterovirga sp.]
MNVPPRRLNDLETAVGGWLPGSDAVIKFGAPEYGTGRFGERVNKALTYMLMQMTNQARFPLWNQVRRQKHCRETHQPLAAMLGRAMRCVPDPEHAGS